MLRCVKGSSSAPRPFLPAAHASDLEALLLFSELTFSHFEKYCVRVLGAGSLPVTIPFPSVSETLEDGFLREVWSKARNGILSGFVVTDSVTTKPDTAVASRVGLGRKSARVSTR